MQDTPVQDAPADPFGGPPVNLPDVVAEVQAVFARYEAALVGNDVAVLDALFWDSPLTLRYGATENLYGYDAIRDFRLARAAQGLAREVTVQRIMTFGRDYAVTHIEFTRPGKPGIGRQSQCWVRLPQGWRVVAAHVSQMTG